MENKFLKAKRILALTIGGMMTFSVCASAASVVTTEIDNDTVKAVIDGEFEGTGKDVPVGLYITKDGAMAHADQRFLNENGEYSFGFRVNPALGDGDMEYSVSISGDAHTGVLEIVSIDELEKIVQSLRDVSSAQELLALMGDTDPSLNMPVYDKLDKSDWYELLYNEISGGNIPQNADELYLLMKQAAAVAAYESCISELIDGGKLLYLDLIGLDDEYIAAYESEISSKGLEIVNSKAAAKYESIEECTDELVDLILVQRIVNNASGDLKLAKEKFTSDAEKLGIDISDAKGKLDTVCRQLINAQPETREDLVKKYEEICESLTSDKSSGSSSGGGGGGGSASVGSSAVSYRPNITQSTVTNTSVSGFVDMTGYAWAEGAIAKLKSLGAVNGRNETEFAPSAAVTREEFVKMLISSFSLVEEVTESKFTDVAVDSWYAPYVAKAAALGIVTGISESEFGVGQLISRQDMATMAFRALRYTVSEFDTDLEGISFTDSEQIAKYARTSALMLKKLQVLEGYDDGSFRPLQTANRAETAQMIYKMLKLD